MDNIIGPPEKQVMNWTSTPWFVADLKDIRRTLASIRAEVRPEE